MRTTPLQVPPLSRMQREYPAQGEDDQAERSGSQARGGHGNDARVQPRCEVEQDGTRSGRGAGEGGADALGREAASARGKVGQAVSRRAYMTARIGEFRICSKTDLRK